MANDCRRMERLVSILSAMVCSAGRQRSELLEKKCTEDLLVELAVQRLRRIRWMAEVRRMSVHLRQLSRVRRTPCSGLRLLARVGSGSTKIFLLASYKYEHFGAPLDFHLQFVNCSKFSFFSLLPSRRSATFNSPFTRVFLVFTFLSLNSVSESHVTVQFKTENCLEASTMLI